MQIRAVIERITFQSPETGYSVLQGRVKGFKELVCIVGSMLGVSAGSVLLCDGQWKMHPRYGRQFVVENFSHEMPATIYGIEKYLASGLVKGIGPHYSRMIVKHFGLETLDIIENDIERLKEVHGLGKRRINQIRQSWDNQKEIKNVMVFLQGYNVSTGFAAKIFKEYGKKSVEVVSQNPYKLAEDIYGIGFKTADSIAQKLGYKKNDLRRCRSGITFVLNELANDGHVFCPFDDLVKIATELLVTDPEPISDSIAEMVRTKDLIKEDDAIFLPSMYYAETGTAHKLITLMGGRAPLKNPLDIDKLSEITGIKYDEIQGEAIRIATEQKVMVLTGGPGTGKTTTTEGIIAALKADDMRVLLAAPTGRAAKRMSEATGMPAKTIHRLLEYNPMDGYKRNEEEPLEGDALILDECSMIDIALMNNLVKAIPKNMRLVLVGDVDQLPSVGAGNVLRDIIESEAVPVVRLTRIFRQAQSSRIVMNAHAINRGFPPNLTNGLTTDFFFIEFEDPEKASEEIVNLVSNRLPNGYKVQPSQIQVLTPMQRGEVGAINLNLQLQKAINTNTEGLARGGITFRQGDRVMQMRNNYDKEVFNGDLGFVKSVDREDHSLIVTYEDRDVSYDVSDLDELSLAYATTIHKSQGSEYPIVVIPLMMSHYVMLQRNLLYTGITRAKKVCVLVGSKKAISIAVKNNKVLRRNTRLKQRLNGTLGKNRVVQYTVLDANLAQASSPGADYPASTHYNNDANPNQTSLPIPPTQNCPNPFPKQYPPQQTPQQTQPYPNLVSSQNPSQHPNPGFPPQHPSPSFPHQHPYRNSTSQYHNTNYPTQPPSSSNYPLQPNPNYPPQHPNQYYNPDTDQTDNNK